MSERIISLRPFVESDLESLVLLGDNKKVSDNLSDGFPSPYTAESARLFIEDAMSNDPPTRMAITLNGRHVGNIGLHKQDDIYKRTAEIGYYVGEPFWGQGIATEAIGKMVQHGFEVLDIVRIYAGVFEHNKASMRALEKNGFVFEGISRKGAVKNDVILDVHQYAILNPAY